jgi:hypothetical protein
MSIIRTKEPQVSNEDAKAEVNRGIAESHYVVSDGTAATIAFWYASPGFPVGSVLAALSTGAGVGSVEVLQDINATIAQDPSDDADHDGWGEQALKQLARWVVSASADSNLEELLSMTEPLKIDSYPVADLLGRHVLNENGAEFHVFDVRYDLRNDVVVFWLRDPQDVEDEAGITSLRGWTVL